MTKTILFITHSTCGGVERMTLLYAKILKQAGYDCRLLISQKPSDDFELKPFIPDDLPYELMRCRYRHLFYRIPLYLLRTKPCCVFYSFPLLMPSLILPKLVLPGMKVLFRDCNMPSKHRKYQSYPAKYILRYADALIAQTEEMKQEMAAFYHLHPERITVINNPIDKFLIQKSIREEHRFSCADCIHYIAVGRICPQKDYRTLIKAFALVLEKEPESHLDIIGVDWDTAYRKSLDALIMQLGIDRSVTFHGFQENPFKYIEAADVFVLSSVHEGLPNVMIEAMYLGKPVVVTRSIPYIAQVVHDGVNGYAVTVGNHEELAGAMLKARRLEIKEKFVDVNSSEKQIIDLFTEVLETSRNVLLSHLNQDLNSAICGFLEKYSGLHFDSEYLKVPRFDRMGRIGFMLLYMAYAARLFLKRKQLGVVVSWSDYVCGMYYACLCRFFHVRKTSRLILMAFIYNHGKQGLLGRLKMQIVRYAVCSEYVDHVVVFSGGEVDYYHNLLGIPKHKLHFFPLSKNMENFVPADLPIKEDRYIFSVGGTNRDYDFLTKTLNATKYKVHIACSDLSEETGTSNITVHDNLFGTEMQQYMYNSYCVAIPLKGPNIISSGQLVLLQALYLKRPIVCTKGSCVADYLKDGHNALLVDNCPEAWLEAIERLYKDKDLYRKLAENGYKDYMSKHRTELLARNIASLVG